MDEPRENARSGAQAGVFATTHWSVVQAAGGLHSTVAARALEQLCQTYWYPLYAYVRRREYSPEAAADLTQSFFAQLLGGEFRNARSATKADSETICSER